MLTSATAKLNAANENTKSVLFSTQSLIKPCLDFAPQISQVRALYDPLSGLMVVGEAGGSTLTANSGLTLPGK